MKRKRTFKTTYSILTDAFRSDETITAKSHEIISQLRTAINELLEKALLVEPTSLFTNLFDDILKKNPTLLLNSEMDAATATERFRLELKDSTLLFHLDNLFTNLQKTLPENK